MGMSLRDQLMQAGLVKEKPTGETSKKQRAEERTRAVAEQKAAAGRAAAEKTARDAELNRLREASMGKKARMAQVKQLIEQNKLPKVAESDDYFNFIDGKKIKRVLVDAAIRASLIRGELDIVRCEGRYDFVPAAIAKRIRERDERSVIARNTEEQKGDENDPYKDFVVPDDLKW